MSKKISEMSSEELQDYALELEQKLQAQAQSLEEATAKNTELNELNVALQKRNNQLFLSLEQGVSGVEGDSEPPAEVQSCEEFAKSLGGIIRK